MTCFAYARTALKFGLIALGFKKGDRLLIPDYVCEALIQPIRDLSLQPVYFPVNDSLEPKWDVLDSIARKIDCRAIVMVHYFGQPQNIKRYQAFCAAYGLLLIEDNSHGFGGTISGKPLGTFGDFGISSPRKIMDIPFGGILYVEHEERSPPVLPVRHEGIGRVLIRKSFRKWPTLKVLATVLTRRMRNFSDPSAFHEPTVEDNAADVSLAIVKRAIPDWARQRRERWMVWQKLAPSLGLRPVYASVHPESSPWMFPAYVESPRQRKRIVTVGLRNGVILCPWPALPTEVLAKGGEPVDRWHRLICAPLHQDVKVFSCA